MMRQTFTAGLCALGFGLGLGLGTLGYAQTAQHADGAGATTAPAADGQERRQGPPTPSQELDRMNQALTLTEAQRASILPILQHRHSEIETLRTSGDRSGERDAMRTILETSNKQIRALLTEPQQKLFDAMRPRRGGPGGPPRDHGQSSGDAGVLPPPPQN